MSTPTPFTHYQRRFTMESLNRWLKNNGHVVQIVPAGGALVLEMPDGRQWSRLHPVMHVNDLGPSAWMSDALEAERAHRRIAS